MTAFQGPLDLLGATPVDHCAALGCRPCNGAAGPDHGSRPPWMSVVLAVLRSVAAGYSSGTTDCWETGFRIAEQGLGSERAPVLFGHVVALVRLLRQHRELACLPSSCSRLSADETVILSMIASMQDEARLEGAGDVDWRAVSAAATAVRTAALSTPVSERYQELAAAR